MDSKTKTIVDKIIDEIDKSTLLGAAYDCISESGKQRFQEKLNKIVGDEINDIREKEID